MAERQGKVRVESDEVQGKGSFVVVRRLSYGQKRAATRMVARAAGGTIPTDLKAEGLTIDAEYLNDNDAFTGQLLQENVLEWNWVDFDGNPLRLPKDDPGVIDQLTDDEVEFLVRHINPKKAEAQEKN
jgi:hypothetical protein